MEKEKENVILFPKWKKTLEEESLLALKEKKYDEALSKLDQLIDYQEHNHEVIIGKLICLMELDRYEDAQELSENLLKVKDENYYHYLHIYLTILFQTHQYKRLMEQVEHELDIAAVPQPMKDQFQQLYDMSEKMNVEIEDERQTEYISDLLKAVKDNNHVKQWRTVENLRKIGAAPSVETAESLLKEKLVHPVIKTAIFMWLQDNNFDEIIDIHKLDMRIKVSPDQVTDINSHSTYKQILLLISKVEQNNPTLYNLMETLLYRYLYVRYPIMPSSDHIKQVAEALTNIAELNLSTKETLDEVTDSDVIRYQEEIKLCETLYLSVIEE